MPRWFDRRFKLSRIFAKSRTASKFLSYHQYGEGVTKAGWLGYYKFAGRCIGFQPTPEGGECTAPIVWLHEVR